MKRTMLAVPSMRAGTGSVVLRVAVTVPSLRVCPPATT
jgi:hypothetical protein